MSLRMVPKPYTKPKTKCPFKEAPNLTLICSGCLKKVRKIRQPLKSREWLCGECFPEEEGDGIRNEPEERIEQGQQQGKLDEGSSKDNGSGQEGLTKELIEQGRQEGQVTKKKVMVPDSGPKKA